MWLLHLLPDGFVEFIVYSLLGGGVVLTILTCFLLNNILRLLPFLATYYRALQIFSVVILILGIYLAGVWRTEQWWREKVREAEAQVRVVEKEQVKINTRIVEKIRDRVVVVKRPVEIIKKEIEIKEKIINQDCKLNPTAVELYNRAVTGDAGEQR